MLRNTLTYAALFGGIAATPACLAQSTGSADLLHYSISASDSVVFGYNGADGTSDSFNISGSAGYVSSSERHPLSFVYGGGYLFGNNGQPSSSFQSLGISQLLNTRKWTFILSDVATYLPVSPRFGISGVPGVGDIGTQPIGTGIAPGDALLTNFGRRIANTVQGGASLRITGRTSMRNSASYNTQHFLDGNGIENNSLTAGTELDHGFTNATTVGAGYTYGRAMYPQTGLSFISQSVVGTFQHIFSPRFNVSASAGPQWTKGSNAALVPTRTGISIGFNANYLRRFDTFSASYTRGTSPGSGVLFGAVSDFFNLSTQHRFSENWSAGLFTSYGRGRSLVDQSSPLYTSSSSVAAGLQASRRLGDHFSAFGSYAAEYQTVSQVQATNNAFNGTANVLSFGVSYAPRPIRLGRRR